MPDATVTVRGYSDSAASAQADVLLSQQRAQHVADALVADGVASAASHGMVADRPATIRVSRADAWRSM